MGNHPLRGVHAPTRGHREHKRESRRRRDCWVSAGVEDKVNPCDFRSQSSGNSKHTVTCGKVPAVLTEDPRLLPLILSDLKSQVSQLTERAQYVRLSHECSLHHP
ncbi:hypothetical protein D4764_13G0005860 [Takifugu flavidus]|uniref:Uncharacterized protein n=1 Tax=Takifugu flavidus TaxID=433684 RepID=A0A5C6P7Y7_9TELE|nr:hypothetical protein D4764_13G0005860 [Takifugu flavidus]